MVLSAVHNGHKDYALSARRAPNLLPCRLVSFQRRLCKSDNRSNNKVPRPDKHCFVSVDEFYAPVFARVSDGTGSDHIDARKGKGLGVLEGMMMGPRREGWGKNVDKR